ncbi:hypothetical protein PYW08_002232 [Mythimna loreyi]|uniref:Uncharacterized protein n=1 Tax=Mythimna loreyi TaxID=667449 RepID=A0ACC2R3J6_9NEOP|nr:hypothetical protein PYW08_002232 [Mythimna loreyi]
MVRRAGGGRAAQSSRRARTMSACRAALLRASVLLLCLAGSRQFSIKEFVVPKAVEIGNDAELRCQYELWDNETDAALFVKWWWTPDSGNPDDRKQIYQRIVRQNAEALKHDNSSQMEIKGNDSIVLLNVNPVDSGIYECEVSNNDEIRKHGNLIVFSKGTGPEINYTLIKSESEDEADTLLIECEAEDVAPKPDMIISFQGETINITKSIEDKNEKGFYKIYVNASVSTADVDEGEIRCELTYTTLEHEPYVDVEKYVPAGRAAPPSAAPPADATAPDPTHGSLQNPSDDGIRLQCSWALLTLAAVATLLQAPL